VLDTKWERESKCSIIMHAKRSTVTEEWKQKQRGSFYEIYFWVGEQYSLWQPFGPAYVVLGGRHWLGRFLFVKACGCVLGSCKACRLDSCSASFPFLYLYFFQIGFFANEKGLTLTTIKITYSFSSFPFSPSEFCLYL
jgi:hypothetical protein